MTLPVITDLRALAALVRRRVESGKAVHATLDTVLELEMMARLRWDLHFKCSDHGPKQITLADIALGWLLASKAQADSEAWLGREVLMPGECARAAICAELALVANRADHLDGTREGARTAWAFVVAQLEANRSTLEHLPLFKSMLDTYRRELVETMR